MSVVNLHLSNITLFLLVKFVSIVDTCGVDGICSAAARDLVVAAASKIFKIFAPSSIQVSLPVY